MFSFSGATLFLLLTSLLLMMSPHFAPDEDAIESAGVAGVLEVEELDHVEDEQGLVDDKDLDQLNTRKLSSM